MTNPIVMQSLVLDQQLLDSIPMPIRLIEQSADGTPVFLWVNKSALAQLGLVLEKVVGKSAASLFGSATGVLATERHREVFKSKQSLTYSQPILLQGAMRTLQTTLVPLQIGPESVPVIVATSVDITDHRRNESQWIKAETINREIKEFAALAAHDLRTPMRQVSAFAEILKEDFTDMGDGKLQIIDTIKDVSERAADMVGNMLKSSAHIRESISLVETFELNVVCSDIFTLLDPLRRHNLTRDAVLVYTDKAILTIVLRNLVDNSIKHNFPNMMDVHIAVAASTDVQGQLSFTVSDNGKGLEDLDESVLDSVDDSGESGYGLSALQRLLRYKGGSISASAYNAGKGASFTFALPGELAQDSALGKHKGAARI